MKDLHPGHVFVFIGIIVVILVLYNAMAKATPPESGRYPVEYSTPSGKFSASI